MKKRGELTSFYVVTSILALIGFLILIWLIVRVGIADDAETQACHLSVISRATVPEAARQFVPLHCTTQKVCLRDGSGRCDRSFAGDRIRETKINARANDVGNREATRAVEEKLAQEMYSCWKMMGEGKLDLFQSLGTQTGMRASDSVCVICSRIALDVAQEREAMIVDAVDLPTYLKSHRVPNGELTYLQAFTDPSIQAYARVNAEELRTPEQPGIVEFAPPSPEFAVVFMQIKPQEYTKVLENLGKVALGGATVAGSAFVLTPQPLQGAAGGVARQVLLTPKGLVAAGIVAAGVAGYATWNVYRSKGVAAGYCGEVTVPGGGTVQSSVAGVDPRKGCSMVQVVPYDAPAINTLCTHIESAS